MTNYTKNEIVIVMKTNAPEVTHEMLLMALNTAVRLSMLCPHKRTDDIGRVSLLMDLMESMIPSEDQFLKMAS